MRIVAMGDTETPRAYRIAAWIGAGFVLVCYATATGAMGYLVQLASTLLPSPLYSVAQLFFRLGLLVLALALAAVVLLALRRPALAIGLAVLPLVPSVLFVAPVHFGVIATLAAIGVVGAWRDLRAAIAALAIAELVLLLHWLYFPLGTLVGPVGNQISMGTSPGQHGAALGVWTLCLLVVLCASLVLRSQVRQHADLDALQVRSVEVEEQSAVTAERARLARDLHDVVAHHVSLIAVRAETAPYTHPGLDATARGLLAEVAQDARLALDELRGVLGILGRAAGDAERQPQPGLSDVPALVDRSRSAGTEVVLDVASVDVVTPAAVEYVAYRVVQESLTNARRHAPGSAVRVSLAGNASVLIVQVTNPLGAEEGGESGRGLVGMLERVEAVGGHLEAGRDQGSFVVRATLPRAAR